MRWHTAPFGCSCLAAGTIGQGCIEWLGRCRSQRLQGGSSSAGVLWRIFAKRTLPVHFCACRQLRLEARSSNHCALQAAPAKPCWTHWSNTLVLDRCVPSAAQERRLGKSSLHVCWLKCSTSCCLLCYRLCRSCWLKCSCLMRDAVLRRGISMPDICDRE